MWVRNFCCWLLADSLWACLERPLYLQEQTLPGWIIPKIGGQA